MKKFRFTFLARLNRAEGIRSRYVEEREGLDIDEARLKLYDVYEHIHIIEEKELFDADAVSQPYPN